MDNPDVRWKQRFSNFNKALGQLGEFISLGEDLNKFEKQGMIKAFEYTYELAWTTIKDYYEYPGEVNIQGSRDAISLAFNRGLISINHSILNKISLKLDDLYLPHIFDLNIYHKINNTGLINHINRVGASIYKNLKGNQKSKL